MLKKNYFGLISKNTIYIQTNTKTHSFFRNSDNDQKKQKKGKRKILVDLVMSALIICILHSLQCLQYFFYSNHTPSSTYVCYVSDSVYNVFGVAG